MSFVENWLGILSRGLLLPKRVKNLGVNRTDYVISYELTPKIIDPGILYFLGITWGWIVLCPTSNDISELFNRQQEARQQIHGLLRGRVRKCQTIHSTTI